MAVRDHRAGRIDPDSIRVARRVQDRRDQDGCGHPDRSIRSVGFSEKTPAVIAGWRRCWRTPRTIAAVRLARCVRHQFGRGLETLLKVHQRQGTRHSRGRSRTFGSAIDGRIAEAAPEVLAMLADGDFEVRIAVIDEVASLGHELKDDMETMKLLRASWATPTSGREAPQRDRTHRRNSNRRRNPRRRAGEEAMSEATAGSPGGRRGG